MHHVLIVVLVILLVLTIVIVLFRVWRGIHIILLLNDFDILRIYLHVGRTIVKYSWRYFWHGVCQSTELCLVVSEAAINSKFADPCHLEVFASLSLVIAVQNADELLSGERLRQRLKIKFNLNQEKSLNNLHHSCYVFHHFHERSYKGHRVHSSQFARSACRLKSCTLGISSCLDPLLPFLLCFLSSPSCC